MLKQTRLLSVTTLLSVVYLALLLSNHVLTRNQAMAAGEADFRVAVERAADSLSLFLLERENDVRDLAATRELHTYFAHLALGMSLQYGLAASLEQLQSNLAADQQAMQLLGDPLFAHIAIVEPDGRILAAAPTAETPPLDWFVTTAGTDAVPQWQVVDAQHLLLALRVDHKGRHAATLVATLALEPIYRRILSSGGPLGRSDVLRTADHRYLHAPQLHPGVLRRLAVDRPPADALTLLDGQDGPPRLAYDVGIAVGGLGLLAVDSAERVRGGGYYSISLIMAATLPLLLFALLRSYVRSERLRAEGVVAAQLNVELEQRVAQRTGALAAAAAEAARANAAKTEFISKVTHDLRTPMHAILSYADLGRKRIGSAATAKIVGYFDKITTSSERLLTLVNDLLDIAKLEAGRVECSFDEADFVRVVIGAMDEYQPLGQARGISVVHDGPAALAVNMDQLRIGQVVRNLLSNALKFTPNGGHIWLRTRVQPGDDGGLVEFIVADDGPGILDGEYERVFEKFHQSDRTRSTPGGTGLGLSISRELVLLHRGTLHAEPRPGGGSRFVLRLPVAGPPAASGDSAAAPVASTLPEDQPKASAGSHG